MVITLKVALLGESGVGKTAILYRFIKDIFDKHIMVSLSGNFVSKTIILEECL